MNSGTEHAHLVRIHDAVVVAFDDERTVGLVLDYAAGGSLGQLVTSRESLTVGETVTVLTPVAQALAYLHHRGSEHSDVSPGNVLFTEHGKPLLSDLGVARMVGDPAVGVHAGTPGFTDPAPPLPGQAVQPARDVYSLAALGWYCLTGLPPESASRRPPLSIVVPDVPPTLAAALEAGLQEEILERPTAAEFATAIFRCAAAQSVDLSASVHPTVLPELLTRKDPTGPQRFHGIFDRQSWNLWTANVIGLPARGGKAPPRLMARVLAIVSAMAALLLGGMAVATGWWPPGLPGPPSWTGHGNASKEAEEGGKVERDGQTSQGAQGGQGGQGVQLEAGKQPIAAAAEATAAAGTATAGGVPQDLLAHLAAVDPAQAVHALADLRSLALRTGSSELLGRVNAPGTPAAAADAALVSELTAAGVVLAGFTTTVSKAETLAGARGDKATVRVESSTSAYQERGRTGDVVRSGKAAGPQQLDLFLVRQDGEWLISEILAPSR